MQSTQELRLRGKGKVDHLIEEKGSAFRKLKLPDLSLMCSGERPLFITEELRFDEGVRDCAAVDSDKWFLASGTELMDRASHEFLAGAGLTFDEDRERGISHLSDLLDNFLHLPTWADEPP